MIYLMEVENNTTKKLMAPDKVIIRMKPTSEQMAEVRRLFERKRVKSKTGNTLGDYLVSQFSKEIADAIRKQEDIENRKNGIRRKRGLTFPKLKHHKLDCYWCGGSQDVKLITKLMESKKQISYPCDKCTRRLKVIVTVAGFFSAYPADRTRYLRNKEKGTSRI